MEHWLLAFAFAFPTLLLLSPIVLFLARGWHVRKENTIGGFTPKAIVLYFKYYYTQLKVNEDTAQQYLSYLFNIRFGLRHFIFPTFLLVAAVLASGYLMLGFLAKIEVVTLKQFDPRNPVADAVTIGALVGAYMWSFLSLESKSLQRNMHPRDLIACSFRFFISVPIAHVFALALQDQVGAVVAVFLGAFPFQTIVAAMRRNPALKGLMIDATEPQYELKDKIRSVNLAIAEQLDEQGISTIVQLAYCDPIDVAIRSGYEINWIADWQAEAIVCTYFPKEKPILDRYGLRGSIEIGGLIEDLEGDDPIYSQRADVLIKSVASELNRPTEVVIRIFVEIAYDPYAEFLKALWHQVGGEAEEEDEPMRRGSPGSWSAPLP